MKIDFKNKKTMMIAIVCIILIVLICVGVVYIVTRNKESKISKLYSKLENVEKYSVTLNQDDGRTIIMAKNGNDTSIDMQGEDMHSTILIKDGKMYYIDHDEKKYDDYGELNEKDNVLFEELDKIKEKEYTKGKEKVNKKNYNFEEYKGYSGFMYSSNIDIEEEDINTRFYFKGDDLKYIKTILSNDKIETIDVEITFNPNDSFFDIPKDYTIIDFDEYTQM